ncbi:MAG: hypothetical protein WC426_13620 [Sulfuriferula sp.]
MVQNTNIPLNHTLRVYDIQADDFGDVETLGDYHSLAALVEDTQGFENSDHIDNLTGSLLAFIEPTDPYYVSRNGKLYGLVAQFSRFADYGQNSWYKITSVRPGESLIGGGDDLVELTLVRTVPGEAAADEES